MIPCKLHGSTITLLSQHQYGVGEIIITEKRDHRRWKKLLHKIMFLKPPVITKGYKVVATTPTTMTIKQI